MREYLVTILLAALITYLITPIVRDLAIKAGAVTAIRDRDIHLQPTPRWGGLAMWLAMALTLVIVNYLPLIHKSFGSDATGIFLSGTFILVLGMIDDRFDLDPITKFAGQALAAGILLILVFTQGMKIEIPIVSTKYRGFQAVYPIKMMYVSNIPVILASALTANAVFVFQMIWSNFNPRNNNFFVNFIAQFDPTSPSTPIGGIIYYVTPPRGLDVAALDPMRAVGYVLFMIGIVVVFGRLWVELGGLSPKSAAQNLLDADVQIPGFRRSNKPVEALLNKYIPSVTIIGSCILGLLAGVSDVLGVFGSGIGVLLMVDIMINYYTQLVREQVEVVMPRLGAILGRK